VPGGRYVVGHSSGSDDNISILDLGYTSSADCRLIASVGGEDVYVMWSQFRVQTTPDGMGLTIYSANEKSCSVYEIYPQSKTPHVTQIAHLDFNTSEVPLADLLPGVVIWYSFYRDRIVFRVWDYRLNHSISFSANVSTGKFGSSVKVMATKTAVIFLCDVAVSIWAIPPLLPQPPNFFDHIPTHIPPVFTIPFPDRIKLHSELIRWNMISSWYFGSSQPLYFDTFCQDFKLYRFKILLEPDLSAASLHVINAFGRGPYDFGGAVFQDYRICEDTLGCCWSETYYGWDQADEYKYGLYTGLTSSTRFANDISHRRPQAAAKMLLIPDTEVDYDLSWCPASGRSVCLDHRSNCVTVIDFF